MHALDTYIDRIKSLPPAPRVLTELLTLLRRDDVDSAGIVELIEIDPALTAKVLQRCNSAASGHSQAVHDLHSAVARLGFNEIFRLVATVIGESSLSGAQKGYGMAAGELWRHSAVAAVAARVVAQSLGGDENVVFTAALLHDIGKLVMGAYLEGIGERVTAEIEQGGSSFLEAEKKVAGMEHSELGGRVLQRWGFPDSLVKAVWHHHNPLEARPYDRLAACVYIGDIIAHHLGFSQGFESYAVRAREETVQILEIGPKDLETFIYQTDEALKQNRLFTLPQP